MTEHPRLITFAPMIDSEVWRLLLRHYAIAYDEEPHAFLWGSLLSQIRAGSLQVPALCGAGLKMVDPASAIERWDALQPPGHALVPPDPALHALAMADWEQFHGDFAGHTARLAYYHLLPHRDVMIEPFTRGIPSPEMTLTRVIYPIQRGLLSLFLKLNAKTAETALAGIRAIFDQVDPRVRDGRPFLLGDRITLGDIGLVAAGAPVTLPAGNRSPIPPLADLPPAYAALVRELRERPTGRFIQNFYAVSAA